MMFLSPGMWVSVVPRDLSIDNSLGGEWGPTSGICTDMFSVPNNKELPPEDSRSVTASPSALKAVGADNY